MTASGEIIEIQGTCEKKPVGPDVFQKFYEYGQKGIRDVFTLCEQHADLSSEVLLKLFKAAAPSTNDEVLKPVGQATSRKYAQSKPAPSKSALFSLGNRIQLK